MGGLRKLISEIVREVFEKEDVITVYHGTHNKKTKSIESSGLEAQGMGYTHPQWYMVSTDFESALFHATPEEGGSAVVFEFEVPLSNQKWEGFPYFWPPYERSDKSKWFALKQPLDSSLIKKIHYVDYSDYLKQKERGF